MLKAHFAPLYDISMMDNTENFEDFPSSPFKSNSKLSIPRMNMTLKKLSDDPNFKNSTTITSSVSETPGVKIDNLKMYQEAIINNESSSKVIDQEQSDVSSKIISTNTSEQEKISNSTSIVTTEKSESKTSDNSFPVNIDKSGLNKLGDSINKTSQNISSYVYYFISFILLIVIGITVYMFIGKKSKVKVNKPSLDSTISDNTLGTV